MLSKRVNRLLTVIAALLSVAALDPAAAQNRVAATTKRPAPQPQACAAKCDAYVQKLIAEDEDAADDPWTPEEIQGLRNSCMSGCPGHPGAGIANAPAQKPQRSSCGDIVGTWNWPNGSQMAFYKNGTAGTAGQPPGGSWTCSGGTVIASFSNGGRDQYKVAPDGNSLSLTTNWLPGTYTATRKSRN